eukprot:Hpha_TRINITY_DN15310_c1_g3::TRINITY_DN15310_c1_g3_i1::g.91309::m.91309
MTQTTEFDKINIAEDLPNTLLLTDNVVIIVVWVAVLLLICGVLCYQIVRRSARLPALLAAFVLVAIAASSCMTWVITISAEQEIVTRQAQQVLFSAGRLVEASTQAELGSGIGLAKQIVAASLSGDVDLEAPFPSAHAALYRLLQNAQDGHPASLFGIYLGTEIGALAGVQLFTTPDREPGSLVLWMSPPAYYCSPEELKTWNNTNNGCKRETRLTCEDRENPPACKHPACSAPSDPANATCRSHNHFCHTDLGLTCHGPYEDQPCACGGWMPPIGESFVVDPNVTTWGEALPPTLMHRGGFCWKDNPPPGHREDRDGPLLTVHSSNGTRWYGTNFSRADSPCRFKYDPRQRPWYKRGRKMTWSDPYLFAGQNAHESGVTVSTGVPNPHYTGAPYDESKPGVPPNLNDSPWLGVVGIDYTFSSFTNFLEVSKPSPNSMLFLVDTKGNLFGASSLARAAGRGSAELSATAPSFPQRDLFLGIIDRFGSLSNAAESINVLRGDGTFNLIMPVHLPGELVLLCVIAMPYDDVALEAEEASTRALGMAIGISVIFAVFVFGSIILLLRPLQDLKMDMARVAVMDLVASKRTQSVTVELEEMSKYFAAMVRALEQYRSFLPHAVLVDDDGEGDGGVEFSPAEEEQMVQIDGNWVPMPAPQGDTSDDSPSGGKNGQNPLGVGRRSLRSTSSHSQDSSGNSIHKKPRETDPEKQRNPHHFSIGEFRGRRGSLAVAMLHTREHKSNVQVRKPHLFVQICVETCFKLKGVTTVVADYDGVMTVIMSWNAHQPASTHAAQACELALSLVEQVADNAEMTNAVPCIGVSSGVVWFGNLGTVKQRFPCLTGEPVGNACSFARLCQHIGCPALCHAAVYEQVRSGVRARVVDATQVYGKEDLIYELMRGNHPHDHGLYVQGFSSIQSRDYEVAIDCFRRYLGNEPGDFQAMRLLRLASYLQANSETDMTLPLRDNERTYARTMQPQWRPFEELCRQVKLPEGTSFGSLEKDLLGSSTAVHANTLMASRLLEKDLLGSSTAVHANTLMASRLLE